MAERILDPIQSKVMVRELHNAASNMVRPTLYRGRLWFYVDFGTTQSALVEQHEAAFELAMTACLNAKKVHFVVTE